MNMCIMYLSSLRSQRGPIAVVHLIARNLGQGIEEAPKNPDHHHRTRLQSIHSIALLSIERYEDSTAMILTLFLKGRLSVQILLRALLLTYLIMSRPY
ncbi:hypothetical protein PDE_08381 [Penicillium oxalicum 114-2]|uniref:Uncharacterized protein n=1 Tax=Penicillium oxalicum (strain 114-2 / CGMCC 5302) TaxID=933388 RepID=S7ZSN9_PENO1|nr:hypothetical protein PDE_08381 [Penicillium oxalicum 114-2]